ncbi:hypothetical protein Aperf_G00000029980 [Anoplocephala perfoliata]
MSAHCLISEQKLDYIREVVNQRDPKEDYKLIRSIGVGTYGEVYKALRLNTKDYAAVKIIKIDAKDDIKAVLQEIQTLRDCRHPNIVEFYDSYFRHNKLWICMEFCGGYSMQDIYTNTRKPVDEDCIAFLSRETLRGIAYMHSQGKIHRDIKGANILLCNDGAVKIADFGVAAQITHTIQRRNSLIGTPYWMAPEVVAVERKGGYDEKCDIWAVGITAIEYAELQPPMFDLNPLKALRILSMKSYKPPTLRNKLKWSGKFHGFLKYALTKNEKKRPTAALMLGFCPLIRSQLTLHDFVTQPNLSQTLTLQLLQQNRNPEPITFGQPRASESSAAAGAPGGARPQLINQVQTPGLAAKRPMPANAPAANGSAATPKASRPEGVNIKTPANRFPFSSAGLEAASKYVATHQEEIGMVAPGSPSKPKVSRPSSSQAPPPTTNGAPERIVPTPAVRSVYPRFPVRGKRLEDVRIMDELATPLPAYAGNAPTASPAPKPPPTESVHPSRSPVPSAASFSSASTSPCNTLSSSSSGSSSESSSQSSTSSSAACEDEGDEDDEDKEIEEEEAFSEGEELVEKVLPPAASFSPAEAIPKVATDPDATPQPVRSMMSSARTGTIPSGSCNGTLSALAPAGSAKSTEKVTNKVVSQVEDADGAEDREPSRTLKTSDFAAADLDLDVADEQLLAADGVLTLGKCSSNRKDSNGGGDRISEFGFRMHGNPSEEEEDDEEDDEVPDFENIDPEAGFISHPGAKPTRGIGIGGGQRESRILEENGSSEVQQQRLRRRPRRGKSDPKTSQCASPPSQVCESTADITKEKPQQTAQNDFFPEKTGAELADMLRQLKFAQKFAWLSGEPSAAPLGLSSFNPGSVPSLHHAKGSPDAASHLHGLNGRSQGSDLHVPPTTQSAERSDEAPPPPPSIGSPLPRPKISAPEMRSGALSSSALVDGRPRVPFNVSPDTSSSPFALSSVQSVVNLSETPPVAETGTLTTASSAINFTSPLDFNGKIDASIDSKITNGVATSFAVDEQEHEASKATRTDSLTSDEKKKSQPHLPERQPTEDIPSGTAVSIYSAEISLQPSLPVHSLEAQQRRPLSAIETPLSLKETSSTSLVPRPQALTSPCLPTQSFLCTEASLTSYSLESHNRHNEGLGAEKVQVQESSGHSHGLRRIVEEESRIKAPGGTAPLADQELEEEDIIPIDDGGDDLRAIEEEKDEEEKRLKDKVEVPSPPCRVAHPRRIRSSPILHSVVPPTTKISNSCPSFLDLTRSDPLPRRFIPRKTASAPSITEEDTERDTAGVEVFTGETPAGLKAVATEPVIKRSSPATGETNVPASVKNAPQHRVSPPTYLSPQPSRLLRRLRQSPISGVAGSGKVRPTSVSFTSLDHDLQKLAKMGGSVSGSRRVPPWAHQSTTDIPPTPQVHMGACFTLVFEGCPLTINSTASWINPANNGQILLFGSTEGIYFLSLRDLADRSLELLSSRYCHWLAVVQNTMVSVSGNPAHLYTHNLTTLMKMKASGHSMNAKLKGISNLFPKRFSPSNKVSKTKGCLRASLVRSPFTGARYLCAAFPYEILVMEWVNTLSTFIETKRVPVSNMPKSLTTFDLLVQQDLRFPLACLGVYRHHSRRGLAGERYRLHLVNLNSTPLPTDSLSVVQPGEPSSSPPPPTQQPLSTRAISPPVTAFNTPALEAKKLASTRSEDAEAAGSKASAIIDIARDSNSFFLEADRLPVVSVIQLLKNTVLVCFPDCAKLVGFSGRLRKKLRQPNTITFDGLHIQSVVGLRDSLLVFHPHGFLGKSFAGELTQEINDDKHIYRVLGHDRNIVVESRPVGGSSNNSNIYLLAGHTDNSS